MFLSSSLWVTKLSLSPWLCAAVMSWGSVWSIIPFMYSETHHSFSRLFVPYNLHQAKCFAVSQNHRVIDYTASPPLPWTNSFGSWLTSTYVLTLYRTGFDLCHSYAVAYGIVLLYMTVLLYLCLCKLLFQVVSITLHYKRLPLNGCQMQTKAKSVDANRCMLAHVEQRIRAMGKFQRIKK